MKVGQRCKHPELFQELSLRIARLRLDRSPVD
jgi:hypothetical protein